MLIYKKFKNKAVILKFILRALRYRNYRLFFTGQSISLVGSWMQIVTMSWLAYRLTNSAFLLGVIGFTSQIPIFLISPFAGVLADRWNRKSILLITQTLAMTQAFILAALSFIGVIEVWHIILLSIFIGLVNAFDAPARQAFVVNMVENKEDLGNAIALNSLIFNAARLIGGSLAGIVIALSGEGMCFLLNGLSFLAVIVALWAMKVEITEVKRERKHVLLELKEGLIYVFNFASIRYILLLVTLISLVGMPYTVLMPVFAKDILSGGANILGFLMGTAGLGAIAGAVYLAGREKVIGLERIIPVATIIFGIGLIAFSFSRFIWVSLLLMLLAGFGVMVQIASCNTVLQNLTHDDKRGRVMSFHTIAFMGMAPFGSLLIGSLAGRIGAQSTLLISGFCCILGALFFAGKISLLREAIIKNAI